MSLITCIECSTEYSDKAIACPKCACPTQLNLTKTFDPNEYPIENRTNISESNEEIQTKKVKSRNLNKRVLIQYIVAFIFVVINNSGLFIPSSILTYHDLYGYSITYDITYFLAQFLLLLIPVIIVWLIRKYALGISKDAGFLINLHSILIILLL